jgi:hypothetical protein
VTRHDFGREDLHKWALRVTKCGQGIAAKQSGQKRTEEEGVYPLITFQPFMSKLKAGL